MGKFEKILEFLNEPCIEYIESGELEYYKKKVKELESRIRLLEKAKVIEADYELLEG